MKLTKISQKLKIQFLTNLPSNDIYLKSFVSLGFLSAVAAVIWFWGPSLIWNGSAPLMQPEKRMYVIAFLGCLWLLKFLLIDLDSPNPFQHKDIKIRKKLSELQHRFYGALRFLNKTTISKYNKLIRLHELPWHLLIGPSGAGKTTLLANSGVHFILQRRLQGTAGQGDSQPIQTSENCDWWVTSEASIIDVPGRYLLTPPQLKSQLQNIFNPSVLWRFFLRLVRKNRGKRGVQAIIIALSLPEILKLGDTKRYQAQLHDLFQRLYELQKLFPYTIPCQLVITKCDLLAGFPEFFAESADEEIGQAWGFTLQSAVKDEKAYDLFSHRFNALIKKLNEQLIWRLHQERNPMSRPYIKDFPLQMERVKELALDFMKRLTAANFNLSMQGVYLTSAMQTKAEPENDFIDESLDTGQRALQIFKDPLPVSRSYFIKQFIAHGLAHAAIEPVTRIKTPAWKRPVTYVASIGVIAVTAAFLGKDFQYGVQQAYAIENNISDYQVTIQQITDPNEHLAKTVLLLNSLQHYTKDNAGMNFDLMKLMSFYSNKSQIKANEVYQQALRTILLPEIKNYFTEYLDVPVNKNAEHVYGVLKAYLMLGDAAHFQPIFITHTLRQILPKTISEKKLDDLLIHFTAALNTNWTPMPLSATLIQDTRRYLTALQNQQLAYIILKNTDNNNDESGINLGLNAGKHAVFTSQPNSSQILNMFTAKAFPPIVSQESTTAANEAMVGNWVLGDNPTPNATQEMTNALLEQVRTTYLNNYIGTWENVLTNIHLSSPENLAQADTIILNLISNNSPLLQLLQTLHDNTYFEPITTSSPKLQTIGSLLEKNNASEGLLYQIFTGLQGLHQYLQIILSAHNEDKAAFEAVSNRMVNHTTPDAITQLRLIADKSPEPVKEWLNKLTNDAWHFLMTDAGRYIDTSWQNHVIHYYDENIANRFPFNPNAEQEVAIDKFTEFFGNPGTVINFYNHYLQAFVDTSTPDWQWKKFENNKLPFADETLRQLQQAMRIHDTFFPNGDNKLFVQFALQPYKFGKYVRRVRLNINNKQFVDDRASARSQHAFTWPNRADLKLTSVQLFMANLPTVNRNYTGDWGWFKLVNQSFETMISKKEIVLNLSMNQHPAKYLLFTDGKFNTFLSLNLRHFHLPQQLNEQA